MPVSFQGILLASDLDGTLIDSAYQVPQRNLDALQYFMDRGGCFAIATGRAIESAERYVRITHPNAPCIVLNGTMIYDYDKDRVLWGQPLPSAAKGYLKRICDQFPEVGAEICTDRGIYVIRNNQYIDGHLSHEHIRHKICPADQVQGQWYKVFFAMDAERMVRVRKFTESFSHGGVRFVPSSSTYFEMLPENIDKGLALGRLIGLLGIERENTYAIGDYYNDIELLNAAGNSIVPGNAPKEIRRMADCVVCRCGQGAVADAIERIEQQMKGAPVM